MTSVQQFPAPSSTTDDAYGEIVAELRRIADDLETVVGAGLPVPFFSIDIQPGGRPNGRTDERTVTAVDAVAMALLGRPGETYPVSGSGFHYGTTGGFRGRIRVSVYDEVSDPAARERDAELAQLRAELAAVRASAAGTEA